MKFLIYFLRKDIWAFLFHFFTGFSTSQKQKTILIGLSLFVGGGFSLFNNSESFNLLFPQVAYAKTRGLNEELQELEKRLIKSHERFEEERARWVEAKSREMEIETILIEELLARAEKEKVTATMLKKDIQKRSKILTKRIREREDAEERYQEAEKRVDRVTDELLEKNGGIVEKLANVILPEGFISYQDPKDTNKIIDRVKGMFQEARKRTDRAENRINEASAYRRYHAVKRLREAIKTSSGEKQKRLVEAHDIVARGVFVLPRLTRDLKKALEELEVTNLNNMTNILLGDKGTDLCDGSPLKTIASHHFPPECEIPEGKDIIHIPQLHGLNETTSPFINEKIIYAQFLIGKFILKNRDAHYISEKVIGVALDSDDHREGEKDYKDLVDLMFNSSMSYDDLPPSAKDILAHFVNPYDATYFLFQTGHLDTVYPVGAATATFEIQLRIRNLREMLKNKGLSKKRKIEIDTTITYLEMDARERLLKEQVERIRKQKPNEKIFFVYGNGHDFSDEFEGENFHRVPDSCFID